MSGRIYLLLGKSSAGKDRMYRELLADEALQLHNIVLYTTRPMRAGEENGKQYYFIDEAGYEKWRADGRIIEERVYQTMAGPWRYFTADDGQIDLSAADYLMIGTPEAAVSLEDYFGGNAVDPLYVEVDDRVLLERAMHRENKQEHPRYDEMCRRFLADREDFSEEKLAGAGVIHRFPNNGDPGECLAALKAYILSRAGQPAE
ncbi:MAG: guanylate kinase [Lachnospiraceae bacterium]|nr:guanylate kinase [Lachnospiraceae bacterium]